MILTWYVLPCMICKKVQTSLETCGRALSTQALVDFFPIITEYGCPGIPYQYPVREAQWSVVLVGGGLRTIT